MEKRTQTRISTLRKQITELQEQLETAPPDNQDLRSLLSGVDEILQEITDRGAIQARNQPYSTETAGTQLEKPPQPDGQPPTSLENRSQHELDSQARFPIENPNPVMRIQSNGNLQYSNPAGYEVLRQLGWQPGERLPAQFLKTTHKVLRKLLTGTVDQAVGEKVYAFNVVALPDSDEINIYGSDVTQRVRAEYELQNAHKKLIATLESITDAYYSVDAEWRFLEINPVAERILFQRPAAELVGKRLWDVFPQSVGNKFYQNYHKAVREDVPVHFESKSQIVDCWFEVHAYPREERLEIYLRDISERKRAETALKESNSRLNQVLGSIADSYLAFDNQWRILEINPTAEREIFGGRKASQLLGKVIWEEYPQTISTIFYQMAHKAVETRQMVHFEGLSAITGFWYEAWCYPRANRLDIYQRDITVRRQTEQDAFHRRQQLTEILESINDGFLALDRTWRFTYINKRAARNDNREPLDLMGKVIWDEFPNLIGTRVEWSYRQAMQERVESHFELYDPNRLRWYDVKVYPSAEGISVYWLDVTARKKAEESLRESENRLAIAQEAADLGLWEWDFKNNQFYWSPRMRQIYGVSSDEMLNPQTGAGRLLPEDEDRIIKAFDDAVQYGRNYRAEFRILHPERGIRWVEAFGKTVYGPDEKPNRMVGINRDITSRKEMEDALRALNDRFNTALKNSPIFVYTTDLNLRYTWVFNPLPGMTAEDMIGKRDDQLMEHASAQAFSEMKKQVIQTGQGMRREIVISIGPDDYSFDMTIEPLRSAQGEITGATGAGMNNSEQRRVERQAVRSLTQVEMHGYLTKQREIERQQIARDLHDGPLQDMYGVRFAIKTAQNMGPAAEVAEILTVLDNTTQALVNELRAVCADLRPPALGHFGLDRAIASYTDAFQAKYPKIEIELDLDKDDQELSESVRLALYRIYQEAMNNAGRHAGASRIWVRFLMLKNGVRLEVKDNGHGFEVPGDLIETARQGHLGLVGIHERAEAIGGSVRVESRPGSGTQLSIEVPLNDLLE